MCIRDSTNQPATELPQRLQKYGEEYLKIHGKYLENSTRTPLLWGPVRPEIIPWLQKGCDLIARPHEQTPILLQPDVLSTSTAAITPSAANPMSLQPGDAHYRAYVCLLYTSRCV